MASSTKSSKAKAVVSEETGESDVKLIKRYTNRKLYDTTESRYVTLDEIAEMVRVGEDVRIVDNRSKEDLTSITLAQIIFEQEKKKSSMPLGVLRGIVRHGGESFQDLFERGIQPVVVSIREGAEHTIEKMFRRERGEHEDEPGREGDGEATEEERGPEKESAALARMLSELRDQMETWQRCLDYRVQVTMRDAAKLPVRAMHVPSLRKSLGVIRGRIDELERKLDDLEKKAK